MERLDPIRYEIFYNKLDQIVNEGKEVIRYLSGSTITRESGEVLSAFYLPSGEAVIIACGILMHVMNVTRVIKYMKDNRYDASDIGIYDGDHFINNDPYIGGMHVPDTAIVAPVFYRDEVVGWVAGISHTTETGAIEPGGMAPSATEAYHDGIHLPAVKLVDRGRMRRDLYNMILRSVRDQRGMELDLRARIAGNERVKRRIIELIDEFGLEFFKLATEEIVNDAERQARDRIRRFKPGRYIARHFSDSFQPGKSKLSVIELDMEVTEDSDLIFRFPVVSPQSPCYDNAYIPAVEATIFYNLLVLLFYDCRWNTGIARAIKIEVLEHSRINADADMSVGYATVGIGSVLSETVSEVLCRALYTSGNEEDVMLGGTVVCAPIISGIDQFGRIGGNAITSCALGGSGGRIGRDGHDTVVAMFTPRVYAADTEGEEMLMPLIHTINRFRPDSSGFGKYRGGSGFLSSQLIHRSNSVFPVGIGTGNKIPPTQGIFGGYPGASSYFDLLLDTSFYEEKIIPVGHDDIIKRFRGKHFQCGANFSVHPMKSGDMILMAIGGGAGIGDPIDRDPELILRDIEDGLATVEVAERVYRVAIDRERFKIDYGKTKKLREKEKRDRLKKGIPVRDYIEEMVRRRRERNYPEPAQAFLDEIEGFSPEFREEIEFEERFMESKGGGVGEVKIKRDIFNLTLYLKVVEDEDRRYVIVCRECGYGYCYLGDNFKLYSLIYERDPMDIQPGRLGFTGNFIVLPVVGRLRLR
jgi:N-methylhydantoinase B/oxoprolinase/acetone carboxylase alpha subunit